MIIKRLLSYFPSKLPVGLSEFDSWSTSIINLAGRFADEDSLRFVLANAILTLSDGKSRSGATIRRAWAPKNEFVQILRRAAANQVASHVFNDIKERQIEAAKKQLVTQPTTVEATTVATIPAPEVTNVQETK